MNIFSKKALGVPLGVLAVVAGYLNGVDRVDCVLLSRTGSSLVKMENFADGFRLSYLGSGGALFLHA